MRTAELDILIMAPGQSLTRFRAALALLAALSAALWGAAAPVSAQQVYPARGRTPEMGNTQLPSYRYCTDDPPNRPVPRWAHGPWRQARSSHQLPLCTKSPRPMDTVLQDHHDTPHHPTIKHAAAGPSSYHSHLLAPTASLMLYRYAHLHAGVLNVMDTSFGDGGHQSTVWLVVRAKGMFRLASAPEAPPGLLDDAVSGYVVSVASLQVRRRRVQGRPPVGRWVR